ncbi:TetR/AcrR family transcriptional regulator [Corynebacterium cystitidis]|uniref:Transcriptional regulator, TetR family n=1 Tax=Corynebacterium cystitidis DSM 20524 TaxID=1121357 RepID=A0A1H9TPG4_9CORY|nr:TetR/AcrR family transcriptional regulator [Corynebacterium cystitidis]WJY82008.1 HTH-type transcriptional repressor KstR2 [Corynebacterium cystitidis DSM 20524]SER99011.1 transcriptional regulator, TetR family [Corynebacterium cystitidis DSM 20524]SNV80907.1 transcriptional regulator [Corynebacterium cystitidis]
MTYDERPALRGRPGYSREQVIAAAVDEFNAHGYEATSMGALAKTLGISKSAIYHHVESKEEILREATNLALRALGAVVEEAHQQPGGALQQLRYVIAGSVRVLCANQSQVTLLLRLRGNSEAERAAMEKRRGITYAMIGLVKQAQDEGGVRSDIDPGFAGRIIFGAVNSIADWYEPGGKFTPEEIAEQILTLVSVGLGKRS